MPSRPSARTVRPRLRYRVSGRARSRTRCGADMGLWSAAVFDRLSMSFDGHAVDVDELAAEPSGDAQETDADHGEGHRNRGAVAGLASQIEVHGVQPDDHEVDHHVRD